MTSYISITNLVVSNGAITGTVNMSPINLVNSAWQGEKATIYVTGTTTTATTSVFPANTGGSFNFSIAAPNNNLDQTVTAKLSATDSTGSSVAIVDTFTANTTAINAPGSPLLSFGTDTSSASNRTIQWNAVTSATDYTLEQQKDSGAWVPYPATTQTSLQVSLSSDGTYSWRIRARNATGYSPYSNIISATYTSVVIPPTVTAPTAPTLSITGTSDPTAQVSLSWTAPTGATQYNLEWNRQIGNYSSVAGDFTGNSITFSDEQHINETTTYYFRIRAKNSVGYSSYSNVVTYIRVVNAPAPTYTNFRYSIGAVSQDVILTTATDYGEYQTFQFPARSFCESKLNQSFPAIPNTLTSHFIIKTNDPPNDLAAATLMASLFHPEIPPPPTGGTGTTTNGLWQKVTGAVLLAGFAGAFLPTGNNIKHKRRVRVHAK